MTVPVLAPHGPAPLGDGPIGVGIVGNGMATGVFHAPYIAATPGLELRAVVSRRRDAAPPAPGVRLVPDIETLLADPAIALVVIATPSASHADLATRALEAGRHVVVEKPFTLDPIAARGLFALAEARGLLATAFHNRRWDADFLGLRAALEQGLIGRPVHFESHFDRFRPEVQDRWRESGAPGSGLWYDLGPHLVDQAVQLFGRPLEVDADLSCLREGARAVDHVHVALHYAGLRVVLHAGSCVAGGEARFRVHGTGGSLIKAGLDVQEEQSKAGLRPGDEAWGLDPEPLVRFDAQGQREETPLPRGAQHRFYAMMAAACRGEGALPARPEDVLLVQDILAAAIASSEQGSRITL
ncbi:oxidoreductase [Novosphingobium sp. 1949]|uniref:Oxidoreductase n=1 Tax=Novosphingobium organovorum TaxID=2930092 RepID=A0ABT0B8I9_9SPHN|nr:oxidoreductase [Novosphingobium organovorum]MCJ2181109.1 oxidoreductase [Novosphingobium organovorum]